MSKRWGNVVNPDTAIAENGADVIRLFAMFMGPIQETKPWNSENIIGVSRFVEKIWALYTESGKIKDEENTNLDKIYNETVKKVTQDYEILSFNTAISQMMIFINAVSKENVFPSVYAKNFLILLNPIAPYITEELWQTIFKNNNTISYEKWPTFDESKLIEENVEMVVQINGKLRDKIVIKIDSTDEEVSAKAQELPTIKKLLEGKQIKKIIVVKNKIVNIVAI